MKLYVVKHHYLDTTGTNDFEGSDVEIDALFGVFTSRKAAQYAILKNSFDRLPDESYDIDEIVADSVIDE